MLLLYSICFIEGRPAHLLINYNTVNGDDDDDSNLSLV